MRPDSEDFEQLRRLLALKRHEQPPPGYFDAFSRQVMVRIKVGEAGGWEAAPASWWHRLWTRLEARPVFAGAFGAAVCTFLLVGSLNSGEAGMPPAVVAGQYSGASGTVDTPPVGVELAGDTNSIRDLFNRVEFQYQARPVTFQFPQTEGN